MAAPRPGCSTRRGGFSRRDGHDPSHQGRLDSHQRPFGTDAVIDFHRHIGYTGLLFVFVHVAIGGLLRLVGVGVPPDRIQTERFDWVGPGRSVKEKQCATFI